MGSRARCERCPVRVSLVETGLPAELRGRLTDLFVPVSLPRGETLFREGSRADSLFALRSGRVKLVAAARGARSQILRLHEPGEFIGLDSLHRDKHPNTAVATDDAELCRVRRLDFASLVGEHPELAEYLLERLEVELEDARTALAELGTLDALRRVARHLVGLVREQTGLQHGLGRVVLELPLSRRDTAAQLGMAEESLSRQLTRLQERGVLERDGRLLVVLDVAALAALAG